MPLNWLSPVVPRSWLSPFVPLNWLSPFVLFVPFVAIAFYAFELAIASCTPLVPFVPFVPFVAIAFTEPSICGNDAAERLVRR